jgi:hypothetical protein
MPGNIFNLDDDIRSLILRVNASLDRVDGFVEEAQRTVRNINEGVTELRELTFALQSGAEAFSEALTKGKP